MFHSLPRAEKIALAFDRPSGALGLLVTGDVKSTTVAELQRDVFALLEHERVRELTPRLIALDLRAAGLVDSLGLNLIIAILRWARERNLPLAIDVGRRAVYLTMLAVGLDRQADLRFHELPVESTGASGKPGERPTGAATPKV